MFFAAMFGLRFYHGYQAGKNMQPPADGAQFEHALQVMNGDEAINGAPAQAEKGDRSNDFWFAQAAQIVMDKVKTQFGNEPEPDPDALRLQKQVDAWGILAEKNAGQAQAPL
jgi:hypothetical protein